MKFLDHKEKVTLVILITLTLVSVTVSVYLALNQTCTNIRTCANNHIGVVITGGNIDQNFKEKYEGLKNKIGDYEVISYDPPINTGNLTPADWNKVVRDIWKMYDKYDAFVLMASHDTIPYTASAMAFMLENLGKPIVVSDGDLCEALVLASQTKIPEVMIASDEKLLRGCRTIANSSKSFSSPNYPAMDKKTGFPLPKDPFQVKMVDPNKKIDVIKLYPGMNAGDLAPYLNKKGLQGIILELWGGGGSPTSSEFLKVINDLAKKGVVIVAVSQYDHGGAQETDIRLLEAGVLSGYDMTTPAAYAKLAFLLGNVEEKKLIGQLMDVSFRGEMESSVNNNNNNR
jgi:L-asparaginase